MTTMHEQGTSDRKWLSLGSAFARKPSTEFWPLGNVAPQEFQEHPLNESLRVLLIADNQVQLYPVVDEILSRGHNVFSRWVQDHSRLIEALREDPWDVIFLHYENSILTPEGIPSLLKEYHHAIPFFVFSDSLTEAKTARSYNAGAADVFRDGDHLRLIPSLQRSLSEFMRKRLPTNTRVMLRTIENQLSSAIEQLENQQATIDEHFMVVVTDKSGVIQSVNDRFSERTGYSREDVIGRNQQELVTGMHSREFFENLWDTVSDGTPWKGEVWQRTRSGQIFRVEQSIIPIQDEFGEVQRLFMMAIDLSEVSRTRVDLELLRQSMEATPVALLITNGKRETTYVNPAFLRLFGFQSDEILGRVPEVLRRVESLKGSDHTQPWSQLNAGESWHSRGIDLARKDGTTVVAEVTISPVGDVEPELGSGGYVCLIRDVTLDRQVSARSAEEEKVHALSRLAAGLTDDLNSALGPILAYAQLAKRASAGNEKQFRRMQMIEDSAFKARDTLLQALAFSGRMDMQRESLGLRDVIMRVLPFMRAAAPAGVRIEVQASDRLSNVFADPGQMEQVVTALLSNATRSMIGRTGDIEIELDEVFANHPVPMLVGALQLGTYVRLRISDAGCGIPAAEVEHVFEPYFARGDHGGGGLGLAVVHGIVTAHGGAIGIESVKDQGTTVEVYLPKALSSIDSDAPTASEMRDLPGGTERVLLVDDLELVRRAYGEVLEALGYRVDTDANARDALERMAASKETYALVIGDVTMPRTSGIDLAEQIKHGFHDTRVVLYSDLLEDDIVKAAHAAGVADVIGKPIDLEEFAVAVRRAIDGKPPAVRRSRRTGMTMRDTGASATATGVRRALRNGSETTRRDVANPGGQG